MCEQEVVVSYVTNEKKIVKTDWLDIIFIWIV